MSWQGPTEKKKKKKNESFFCKKQRKKTIGKLKKRMFGSTIKEGARERKGHSPAETHKAKHTKKRRRGGRPKML